MSSSKHTKIPNKPILFSTTTKTASSKTTQSSKKSTLNSCSEASSVRRIPTKKKQEDSNLRQNSKSKFNSLSDNDQDSEKLHKVDDKRQIKKSIKINKKSIRANDSSQDEFNSSNINKKASYHLKSPFQEEQDKDINSLQSDNLSLTVNLDEELGQKLRGVYNGHNDNDSIIYEIQKIKEFTDSMNSRFIPDNSSIDTLIDDLKNRVFQNEKLREKNDEILQKNKKLSLQLKDAQQELFEYRNQDNDEEKDISQMVKSFYHNRSHFNDHSEILKRDLDLAQKVRSFFNDEDNNEAIMRTIQSNQESADDNSGVIELASQLSSLRNSDCKGDEKNSHILQLKREIEDLNNQLSDQMNENQRLNSTIENQKRELFESNQQKLKEISDLKKSYESQISYLKETRQVDSSNSSKEDEDSNFELIELKNSYEAKLNELQTELSNQEKYFTQLRKEIFEQQRSNEEKQKENMELRKLIENADDIKNKEIVFLKQRLLTQLEKQKELEMSFSNSDNGSRLSSLSEALSIKENEISKLREENERQKATIDHKDSEINRVRQSLQSKIDLLHKENSEQRSLIEQKEREINEILSQRETKAKKRENDENLEQQSATIEPIKREINQNEIQENQSRSDEEFQQNQINQLNDDIGNSEDEDKQTQERENYQINDEDPEQHSSLVPKETQEEDDNQTTEETPEQNEEEDRQTNDENSEKESTTVKNEREVDLIDQEKEYENQQDINENLEEESIVEPNESENENDENNQTQENESENQHPPDENPEEESTIEQNEREINLFDQRQESENQQNEEEEQSTIESNENEAKNFVDAQTQESENQPTSTAENVEEESANELNDQDTDFIEQEKDNENQQTTEETPVQQLNEREVHLIDQTEEKDDQQTTEETLEQRTTIEQNESEGNKEEIQDNQSNEENLEPQSRNNPIERKYDDEEIQQHQINQFDEEEVKQTQEEESENQQTTDKSPDQRSTTELNESEGDDVAKNQYSTVETFEEEEEESTLEPNEQGTDLIDQTEEKDDQQESEETPEQQSATEQNESEVIDDVDEQIKGSENQQFTVEDFEEEEELTIEQNERGIDIFNHTEEKDNENQQTTDANLEEESAIESDEREVDLADQTEEKDDQQTTEEKDDQQTTEEKDDQQTTEEAPEQRPTTEPNQQDTEEDPRPKGRGVSLAVQENERIEEPQSSSKETDSTNTSSNKESDQSDDRVQFDAQMTPDHSTNDEAIANNLSNYELLELIGQGSFSKVYKVRDKTSGQICAAKILNQKTDPHDLKREVSILSKLYHPSTLRFIYYSPVDFKNRPRPVIITEYAENHTLYDLIKMERESISHKDWDETRKLIILYGIASAMQFLHSKNIVHRDLKPQNILIDQFFHPKIGDFGLSKVNHSDRSLSMTKSTAGLKGTLLYMAPELFTDAPAYSEKTDVYAFGMIMYEVITGDEPFPGATQMNIQTRVQSGERPEFKSDTLPVYKNLIECCWFQDASKRPDFEYIVNQLGNDPGFKDFETFDEDEFYGYVEFVEKCQNMIKFESSSKVDISKSIRTEEEKSFRSYSISLSSQVQSSNQRQLLQEGEPTTDENARKLLCPDDYYQRLDDDRKQLIEEAENDPIKQCIVGQFLVEGIEGFDQETDLGIEYLNRSIDGGCIEACTYYCNLLIRGQFVEYDLRLAEQYLLKKLDSHNATVYLLYARVMRKMEKYDLALRYFRKGANKGSSEAMYEYGKMMYRGEGCESNKKEAEAFFDLAKKNGNYKAYEFISKQRKEEERRRMKLKKNTTS